MDTPAAPSRTVSGSVSFGRLLKLARPEWRVLCLGTLFLAVGTAMSLVFPKVMGSIVNEALGTRDRHHLDQLAFVLLGAFAIQGIATSLRFYLFTTAGERVVARLRRDVFQSVLQQEVAFFDERRTGELTNRLSSDATVLQSAVTSNISIGLRNGATALGGITLLAVLSPRLTLIMLAVVPPVALGAMAYGRRVRKLSRDLQDALARSNEVADESISGIRTVRAFDAEAREVQRYGAAVDDSYSLAKRRAVQAGTFMGAASFAGYAATSAVLWYGGRMVLDGHLSVGALASFLIYTMMVAFSLASLSDLWADFMKASGAAQRIFELMDRHPAIPVSGGVTLAQVRGAVVFQDVSFAYPTRPTVQVLRGVNLELRAGEVVALVGPSGSGKSTLASLLARLYDPLSGEILLDRTPLRALDPRWLRRQVGSVAQEPILFSSSIAENIRYARPEATQDEIEAAARTANAHDFISRFPEGYATRVGERGVQLSGGQKQRVAIARAVLKDPRLLVLDEATSALDAESEHLVKEALERLMRGRTTLLIAHRLSTVMGAQRVVVIDGGQVVQSGDHLSLMREDGLYRRLVERQFVAA